MLLRDAVAADNLEVGKSIACEIEIQLDRNISDHRERLLQRFLLSAAFKPAQQRTTQSNDVQRV
jgi:hypothetical protein